MKRAASRTVVAIAALVAYANLFTISEPRAQSATTIKVVQWNVEDGEQPGEIDAIVDQQPDIVFLQEVDDPYGHLNDIVAALSQNQGVQWAPPEFISRHNSMSGASWVAILSKFPMSNVQTLSLGKVGESVAGCATTYTADRAAIGATIVIDGKQLAIVSTRNLYVSGNDCVEAEQNRKLKAWAAAHYPNMTHLYGGDFNHQPDGVAYQAMTQDTPAFVDVWAEALNDGTATSWDSAPDFYEPTKTYEHLDYLFYRNAGTILDVTAAHIPQRDETISDHRMMIATFTVGSGGGTSDPGDGPITDNFDDDSLDTSLWVRDNVFSGSTNTSIPINQVNQRLEIGPIPVNTTGYNGIRTQPRDFTGGYAQVQLVQAPASNTSAYAMFTIGDSDTHYRFWVMGTTLTCEEKVNGVKVNACSLTYSPSAHQFLRISHIPTTGQVVWEAAPASGTGPGQWAQLGTSTWNTTYLPTTAVMFELKAGTSTPETVSPGVVAFDSFAVGTVTGPTETVLLEDEFDDNALSQDWIPSSIFSGSTDPTIPVNEANQRLEIGPLPTNDSGYNGVRTNAMDMTNGYAQVRLVQAAASNTQAYTMLTIGDADTHYRFWVMGTTLTCEEKVNGAKANVCSVTYNPSAHQFLRISHNASTGQVLFEAAPASGSGPGQWTPLGSTTWNTTYLPTSAVMFELKAGSSSFETNAPGTVAFDSFRAVRRQ